jgi:hypothetical protein
MQYGSYNIQPGDYLPGARSCRVWIKYAAALRLAVGVQQPPAGMVYTEDDLYYQFGNGRTCYGVNEAVLNDYPAIAEKLLFAKRPLVVVAAKEKYDPIMFFIGEC